MCERAKWLEQDVSWPSTSGRTACNPLWITAFPCPCFSGGVTRLSGTSLRYISAPYHSLHLFRYIITHIMNDPNTFISGILSPSTPRSASNGSTPSRNSSSTSPTSFISESDPLGEQLLIQLQLLAFSEHGIGSELEEL